MMTCECYLTHFIRDTPAGVVHLFRRDTPAGVVNTHGGFIWYLLKLYAPGVTFTVFPTMLKGLHFRLAPFVFV